MRLSRILIVLVILTTVLSITAVVLGLGGSITGNVAEVGAAVDGLSFGILLLITLIFVVFIIDLIRFRK